MKTSGLSFDEFFNRFDPEIRVIHDYPQNLHSMPTSQVCHPVRISVNQFEVIEDFRRLTNIKLVWYKNSSEKSVNYDNPDAKHLELNTETDESAYPLGEKEEIRKLIENFKINGLTQDIELISVKDTKLNEEIIVDGVHRAIAIYHCFKNERDVIKKMLYSSHFGIYLINFQSSEASTYFSRDFLNFNREK